MVIPIAEENTAAAIFELMERNDNRNLRRMSDSPVTALDPVDCRSHSE